MHGMLKIKLACVKERLFEVVIVPMLYNLSGLICNDAVKEKVSLVVMEVKAIHTYVSFSFYMKERYV